MPRALPLLAVLLLALGFPVPRGVRAEDGEAKLGTAITTLPYTISGPGVYVVRATISTGMAGGRAIDVQADNVTIDLDGHTLANVNATNAATAVGATDRRNVTVRNGGLQGFMAGVDLVSTVTDGSLSSGHLLEDLRVGASPWFGIRASGNGNVVRGCQVANSGGSAGGDGQGYGILVQSGAGARVLDNDVAGVRAADAGHSSFGIAALAMSDALVVGNRVSGPADYGISYATNASGKYRGNLVGAGVTRAFFGPGTDAGRNAVDSDGDGIDDEWERRYFGNLTTATATSDSDGDGVSDLAEYQNNTIPTDYYNGTLPRLMTVGGSHQRGSLDGFLALPLRVKVTNAAGAILPNAPVRFSVRRGGGGLAASPTTTGGAPSPVQSTLDARTNATGIASIYYRMDPALQLPALVDASVVQGVQVVRRTLVAFPDMTAGGSIGAGQFHSAALKTDGTLWTWGVNSSGQLGDGTYQSPRLTAVLVGGVRRFASVAANGAHTLAVDGEGRVWTWGDFNNRLSGNGSYSSSNVPVPAIGPDQVVAVATGASHSLALRADGTVWAWGSNYNGQLGVVTPDPYYQQPLPARVVGLPAVIAIAAGESHSLALGADGQVYAWGNNGYGQLGVPPASPYFRATPAPVPTLAEVVSVSAGKYFSMALRGDGTVWSWGVDGDGQLGDGPDQGGSTPVAASGLGGIIAISAGEAHALALRDDDTVWAWGANYRGQLGVSGGNRNAPVQTGGVTSVLALAAGAEHSLALLKSGTVNGWGYNYDGQLGNGSTGGVTPTPVVASGLMVRTALDDSDGDGLPDGWERYHFGNLSQTAGGDPDNDGLTNAQEYLAGTRPIGPGSEDTDGDGMKDGEEIANGLDPLSDDAFADADGDRYPNIFELRHGTNPRSAVSTPVADFTVDPAGGNGGNNRTTIQAALDATTADYQIVRVSPGVYSGYGNAGVAIPASRKLLLISTAGAATTIIERSSNYGIYIGGECVVDGFTVRECNSSGVEMSLSGYPRCKLAGCVLIGNRSYYGGGIKIYGGRVTLENCLVTKNQARLNYYYDNGGGGIYNRDSVLSIVQCTVVGNLIDPGSDTLVEHYSDFASGLQNVVSGIVATKVVNSILWNPDAVVDTAEIKASAQLYVCQSLVRSGYAGVGNLQVDPLLRADGHLTAASPARNGAGPLPAGMLVTSRDLDGEVRPTGPTSDMGVDAFLDADNDGLPDWWEVKYFGGVSSPQTAAGDPDGDGLNNAEEYALGTNPTLADTDGDTLSDGDEVRRYHTNPLLADSDGNGIRDDQEQDSDGDGLPNYLEAQLGSDPNNPDTNGDGIPDGRAYAAGLSLTNLDMDGDGISNAQERARGTDPFQADTDRDGVPDNLDFYPLDPAGGAVPVDPADVTPPVITLLQPSNAVPL